MKIEVQKFTVPPEVIADFWCSKCDAQTVKGHSPRTGKFFIQSGHIWNGTQCPNPIGSYFPLIIWAICNTCLDEQKES